LGPDLILCDDIDENLALSVIDLYPFDSIRNFPRLVPVHGIKLTIIDKVIFLGPYPQSQLDIFSRQDFFI